MPEPTKISARQLMVLTALMTVGSAILIVPSSLAAAAGQDAWIAALAGCAAGVLFVWIMTAVGNLYPRQNWIQTIETLLGKWPGKIVSLLIVVTFFLGCPAAVMFILGNFITTQIMPETPLTAIHILFAFVLIMAVRLGLETICRAAEILFPWFLLLYVTLVVLVVPEIHYDYLQPLLEKGAQPLLPAALAFFSIADLPLIALLMIYPAHVNNSSQARKAIFIGSLFGGLAMVVISFLTIGVLGPDFTAAHFYPSYELAQKINIGKFLQRLEAFLAAVWFLSLFFRNTVYTYFVVTATAQIFNLKDFRPLVLPMGMIMVVMADTVYPNTAYEMTWDSKTWIPYMLTISVILPLLLLAMYAVRKKFRGKQVFRE